MKTLQRRTTSFLSHDTRIWPFSLASLVATSCLTMCLFYLHITVGYRSLPPRGNIFHFSKLVVGFWKLLLFSWSCSACTIIFNVFFICNQWRISFLFTFISQITHGIKRSSLFVVVLFFLSYATHINYVGNYLFKNEQLEFRAEAVLWLWQIKGFNKK